MQTVTVQIKSRWDSSKVLFSAEVSTEVEEKYRLRTALTMAVEADADLAGAYLADADLAGAYLADAYLADAKITASLTLVGKRPFFSLGPIGPCQRIFHAYITNDGLRLRADCFFGTRDEFVAQLADTHDNNEYAQEYTAALALIDKHVEIWTPAAEQGAAA